MPNGVIGDGARLRRPAILLAAAVLLATCVLASLFRRLLQDPRRPGRPLPAPPRRLQRLLQHQRPTRAAHHHRRARRNRPGCGRRDHAGRHPQPLAEPGLLGVNAGASLGIVLGTAALGVLPVPGQLLLAAGGALTATALVQVIGMIGGSTSSPVRLVLIGVAFSAFAGALIRGVVLTMPNLFRTFIDWEVGSLTRADIPLAAMTTLVVLGAGAALLLAGSLDNIALGDDVASSLGTRVGLVRGLSLVVITLLCATATTVAGPIGFVGLMAPLTASWLMGPHRGWIVALCALGGPVVVLAADVLGRVLARPGEMQVGLLTAFVGSPVLLLMVLRLKDRAS